MIVGAIYNVINAGFIGSLHDTTLLAAVTFGSPLLALVMAVGGVFGTGGGALVSRLLGAAERDPARADEIKHVSSFAVWGAAIVGAVLGGIGLLLLHPLVSLLGADGAAAPATRSFVAVMLAFVPVLAAAFCLEQLVRAEGAARQVMVGLIASTVANVVLDVLFILVLHWGVAGAALATGLANVVVIAYFAAWLATAQRAHEPRAALVHAVARRAEARLRGGRRRAAPGRLPDRHRAGAQQPRSRATATVRSRPWVSWSGSLRCRSSWSWASRSACCRCWPTPTARETAPGSPSALRASAIAVGGITLISAATLIVFREQVISPFSADRSVLAIGGTILTAQLVAMIANGFTGLLTSLFQATGRALAATVMSVTQGVLFIPVVILGNLWFGLSGIIWALTVTEGAMFVVGVVLWLASRPAIERGLAEGGPERAEELLEDAAA